MIEQRCSGAPEGREVRIVSFTDRGDHTAQLVASTLKERGFACTCTACHGAHQHVSLAAWTQEAFACASALVFVGATGIAVRSIAPWVRSKTSDPAVVVVDELARWSIPLLSGHLGGANELARTIAQGIGASPVITTATDGRGLWAVDDWARSQGLVVANPHCIKCVSSALLAGETISLWVDANVELPCVGIPQGVVICGSLERADIALSPRAAGALPGLRTQSLRLVPACVTIGMGCRRGVSVEALEKAVEQAFSLSGIDSHAVRELHTIDLKADEPGLKELCVQHTWRLVVHSAEELKRAKGSVSSSSFVSKITGVDNVCERAALCAGGELILSKQVVGDATVAMAMHPIALTW